MVLAVAHFGNNISASRNARQKAPTLQELHVDMIESAAVVVTNEQLRGPSSRSRRLQAVEMPLDMASNTTASNVTEVTLDICGTCGLPVLGPLASAMSSKLSNDKFATEVTVLSRSVCSECGAPPTARRGLSLPDSDEGFQRLMQAPRSKEMITLGLTQTPQAVGFNSTNPPCPATLLDPDGRINILAAIANATYLAEIMAVVEALVEAATGQSLTFVVENATAVATGGDGQLQLPGVDPIGTLAPLNRMLQGRRYLKEIGRPMEEAAMSESLQYFDTVTTMSQEENESDLNFSLLPAEDPFQCKCVACVEDEHCGGLWYGSAVEGPEHEVRAKIHIVISHCKSDLDWLEDFTAGFVVDSVTVISKCGAEVRGAPEGTDILVLPNVGRCDHTYGYYMSYMLNEKVPEEDREKAVVVFLKDDISAGNLHQDGTWNSFSDMIQIASSERGFACGIKPSYVDSGPNRYFVSAYHEYETLKDFSMSSYSRNIKGYADDTVHFLSGFKNIDEWFRSMPGSPEPQEIVQVCYGGVFASSVTNIRSQEPDLWAAITRSLSRGNNIQEGHFAERSWARLLSTPLLPVQLKALAENADGVYLNEAAMHGPLTRTPKIYVHAGAPVTNAPTMEKALAMDVADLQLDGYRVAVHGHREAGIDIDRLAACMWTGFESKAFPAKHRVSTFCPPTLLDNLSSYLDKAMEERRDVIISNPWLSRASTADALGHYLDDVWEVHPVVFYRRYYDWISEVFSEWRDDNHWDSKEIPMYTVRLVDFVREYCKRLFYGSNIHDDSPYRDFTSLRLSSEKRRMHHTPSFHPDLRVEEMTDLNEYTYFIAKQYEAIPRFADKVHIVNFHDQKVASNFYCDVLSHASSSCKTATQREKSESSTGDVGSYEKVFLNQKYSFEELVLGAYMKGILKPKDESTGFHAQVLRWAKMVQSRLERSSDLTFDDLPIECLEDFEMQRLLQVSLAYEKTLLPDFFASVKGEIGLRQDFAHRSFCSIDVAETLNDPQWQFLFQSDERETLLKAYVHIGGPNTNSAAIQRALIQDSDVLAEDGYYLAIHGAGSASTDDYNYLAGDNLMGGIDLIGPCLWNEEERRRVSLSNKEASVCQPGLLPRFKGFIDKAASNRKNMLISNEWLSRLSSETGIDQLFSDAWDVNIVVYYRRYFEWLWTMYGPWRASMSVDFVDGVQGKVRFVDFARLVNERLFQVGSIGLHNDKHSESFVELVDIQEYTYQLWRQFSSVDRFQASVKIVDYHGGDWNTRLYCDVLEDAENACISAEEAEKPDDRVSAVTGGDYDEVQNRSSYQDLVLAGFYHGALLPLGEDAAAEQKLSEQFMAKWVDIVKTNLEDHDLELNSLPTECLTENELDLLQDVSLAFEKLMMPGKYENGGAKELVSEFAFYTRKNRFCSLDVETVVASDEFRFLFSPQRDLDYLNAKAMKGGERVKMDGRSLQQEDDLMDATFL